VFRVFEMPSTLGPWALVALTWTTYVSLCVGLKAIPEHTLLEEVADEGTVVVPTLVEESAILKHWTV